MENASKALLIAGAILIAILLIAIGMMVFNSANGVIDTAASGMSDYEKMAHDKKFKVYEGSQSGSNVKELLSVVKTHNSDSKNSPISGFRFYNAAGSKITTLSADNIDAIKSLDINSIPNSKMYKVECVPGGSSGIVAIIKVTEQ